MKRILLLLILISMPAACSTTGPAVKLADGTQILPQVSVMENTTSETWTVKTPAGLVITATKTGKNQTSGAAQLGGIWSALKLGQAAAQTNQITARGNAAAQVKSAPVGKNPNVIPKNPNTLP